MHEPHVVKSRAQQIKAQLPPALVLAGRPLVRGALQARRVIRHTANVRRVQLLLNEFFLRSRLTGWGPALFTALARVRGPRDSYRRRVMARLYQTRRGPVHVSRGTGYVLLSPGQLTGLDQVLRSCRALFEAKTGGMDAAARDGDGKRGFLRNLLGNDDLQAHPELVDFALSDELLGPVTDYLGAIPHLNRIDLLYSVPRSSETLEASQFFHLDPEGLKQAKVFINVFDVSESEGPFTFVPADVSQRVVQTIRARRKQAGAPIVGRYTDEEVTAPEGPRSIVRVMGSAGSGVIVDTCRCLHCGSRVRSGSFRLCLYIQYCTSRQQGNTFDSRRLAGDPVRYLAVKDSRVSAATTVAAPHQM